MAKQFRVVGPEDDPEYGQIVSVSEAAESGTLMDELVQMRKIIARALDDPDTAVKELAPLSRRYSELTKEIASLRLRAAEEADERGVSGDEGWSAEAI